MHIGADIPEMIGDPLEFRHQAPEPVRARWRIDCERRLHGAGESNGVGRSRIAADAPRQNARAFDARAAHQTIDALMHVAETLLEPYDRLAAGVKPKMARFDDPRVNRADRNLVQALALGLEKRVSIGRAVVQSRPSQRIAHWPAAMIKPAPLVRRFAGREAEEIAGRALETVGRSVNRRHRRERTVLAGDLDKRDRARRLAQRHPHSPLIPPKAHERRFSSSKED